MRVEGVRKTTREKAIDLAKVACAGPVRGADRPSCPIADTDDKLRSLCAEIEGPGARQRRCARRGKLQRDRAAVGQPNIGFARSLCPSDPRRAPPRTQRAKLRPASPAPALRRSGDGRRGAC